MSSLQVLKLLSWEELGSMNLKEAYETFKSHISKAVEECSKQRAAPRNKNIYMSRAATQLRKKKKNYGVGTYCLTRDALDNARFLRCSNQLRTRTRSLRKDHECKLAAEIKHNSKAFWRYANSRLKTRCRVEDPLDESGELVSDNQAKAELLIRFFTSVFTEEGSEAPPQLYCTFQSPALVDIDVSPQKVETKLASLKTSSSPGPDDIRPRLLKESSGVLASPLSVLFRKSLESGSLPEDWMMGEVIPIYKNGDRRNPASYRPVSLTAIPCKVL